MTMAETNHLCVGIDRCEDSLQTCFALTLMTLGEFQWRRAEGHEWEVGRWPGLRLTLLAQPAWGPHRPAFAICPLPRNEHDVPFILLVALRDQRESSYQENSDTSVTLFHFTPVEVQRNMEAYAHRVFDLAIRLQLPHLKARYSRFSRRGVACLPCMKSLIEFQQRFTAPMSGLYFTKSLDSSRQKPADSSVEEALCT